MKKIVALLLLGAGLAYILQPVSLGFNIQLSNTQVADGGEPIPPFPPPPPPAPGVAV